MNILLSCNEGNKLTALNLFLVFLLCYSSLEFFFSKIATLRIEISGHFTDGYFPAEFFPKGQFPEDISSTGSSPKGSFPKDISANGQFSERKFPQRTVPQMTFPRITYFISGVKK